MNLKKVLFNLTGMRYSPYMKTYYFPKTDAILIDKKTLFDYLETWDELSDRQKAKQWEYLKYLYDEKR